MKRVFIVHGWDGYPEEGWFPWLKAELEKRGFNVAVPQMPHPERPTIDDWVSALARAVGTPDKDTFFVGHSIGCQTVMRYLAGLPAKIKVGGVLFVAGFFELQNMEDSDSDAIARPWLSNPLDTDKVKTLLEGRVYALFSPTDRWVPIINKTYFEQRLNAHTFVIEGKGEKGHFSGSDGVTQLPKALELVLEMSK